MYNVRYYPPEQEHMSTELKKKLIQYNTRSPQRAFFNKPLLSPWFDRSLDRAVARGDIADNMDL